MFPVLIVYDCKKGMQKNPRRVQFTKGLYGYRYEWDTKAGRKRNRKEGLLDDFEWVKVGESAILVKEGELDKLTTYFELFSDVIDAKVFKITQEIQISGFS